MPSSLQAAFLARARLLNARKGQIVIGEGTSGSDVYLIQSGRVFFSRLSPLGREFILRDLGPGQILGEIAALNKVERTVSVTASEASQLHHMSGAKFADFIDEVPGAGLWLAKSFAARVCDLTDKVFDLATKPVAARVQAELLRLAGNLEDNADHSSISFPMPTHAELAARVGSHREAVSRELSLLAQQGLVRQCGRRLEILSLTGLQALHARVGR